MQSKNKQKNILLPIAGCAILALIWWIVGILNIFDHRFIPTMPTVVQKLFYLFIKGEILTDIFSTAYKTIVGFLVAGAIAVPAGLMLGSWKSFRQMFAPAIDFMRSLPGTAMFPLFLLLFGIGDGSKIAIAGFLSFWVILINSIYGALYANKHRKLVAQSFGANRWQIFYDVTLHETIPHILVGLKTGMALALISVIISEMIIGSGSGIGQKIYDSYIIYDTPGLFAWIVVSGIIGFGLSKIFSLLDLKLLHWADK